MSTDAVVCLRCDPASLRERYPYVPEGGSFGNLGPVLVCWGEDFVELHTHLGSGCTVEVLLAQLETELPGILQDVPQADLAVGLEGFEGGMNWQTALAQGMYRLVSDLDRQRPVWTAVYGEDPPPRSSRTEVSPIQASPTGETAESIDAMAEALLNGQTVASIRAKLRRGELP
ncbi:MAG: hypothetical protein ACI9VR_004533 [Cognaticolwellia sp.]|jgi:hypothetical protein